MEMCISASQEAWATGGVAGGGGQSRERAAKSGVCDGAGTPPRGGKSLIREMNADRSHRTRNISGQWRWRWRWAPDKVINNKKQAPPK